jgi:hypothetical protein
MMNGARLAVLVPTIAVAAMAAIACAGAFLLPERARRRRYGVLAAALCGGLALAATVWQQQREAAVLAAQRAAVEAQDASLAGIVQKLRGAGQRFDAVGQLMPAVPGSAPAKLFDTVDAGFAALAAEADDLDKRVQALREVAHGRAIDDTIAAAMIEYLRPRGVHRVVVSCVTDDAEAYLYANRVATILRQAGWDAVGPEITAIFGDAPAMGISLYARAGQSPEAALLLVDAFTRFNIPYQSRIAANDAIPDNETVELFVGKKP